MTQRLTKALARRAQAQVTVETVLREDYPVGSELKFLCHHGMIRHGIVKQHCFADTLIVENTATGGHRKIWAGNIRGRV